MRNEKALFLESIMKLFYLELAALVLSIIAALPFEISLLGWLTMLVSLAGCIVLFQLSGIHAKYRKASMFMAVSLIGSLLLKLNILPIIIFYVASICSIVAQYQEYTGHSEMMKGIDEKLSTRWHSLFNWSFFGSLVVAMLGSGVAIAAILIFQLDASTLTNIELALSRGFDIVIMLCYLRLLKLTHDAYEKYEIPASTIEMEE